MPVNWMDVSNLSFNTLLLLERVQISWLPTNVQGEQLATALRGNPTVEWYLRHKCPELEPWLEQVMAKTEQAMDDQQVREAEIAVLRDLDDWIIYVVDPAVYDRQPFLGWDSQELTALTDFNGKTVIDVGSGTGRLALAVADEAKVIFAVEPVGNLRRYLREKARKQGLENVYAVDGLIKGIPFPDGFADVTMAGHVFGEAPEKEIAEMSRVTRPGGMVILCPGNNDRDNDIHDYLISQGFEWGRFEEPEDGMKRKYWRNV